MTSTMSAEMHGQQVDELVVDEILLQRREDVEYTKLEDLARMVQEDFDDVVVELALHNYESYYALKPGSVNFTTVNGTSAGIQGWAACHIRDVKPAENYCGKNGENQLSTRADRSRTSKGDEEEEAQLRVALMESMLEARGVHPATRCRPGRAYIDGRFPYYSDEDEYSYEGDEESCGYEGVQQSIDGDKISLYELPEARRMDSDSSWSQISTIINPTTDSDSIIDAEDSLSTCDWTFVSEQH